MECKPMTQATRPTQLDTSRCRQTDGSIPIGHTSSSPLPTHSVLTNHGNQVNSSIGQIYAWSRPAKAKG